MGLFSAPVADAIFVSFASFFYYCTCNKLNKGKVEFSFRVARRNGIFVLSGHKELEPRLKGSNLKFLVNFTKNENGKFVYKKM